MILKEELLVLKTKLLPSGAEAIVDFLVTHCEQLEQTQIVLENVPLLIIGRHGMIARISLHGKVQKVSQLDEIMELLQIYFASKSEPLFLFVNLPDLPVPSEVILVLAEVTQRAMHRAEIESRIDAALDARDRNAFEQAVKELNELTSHDYGVIWTR